VLERNLNGKVLDLTSEIYTWKCARCGLCCIHTVSDTPFGRLGAFLMPNETGLFPKQYVKPMYGVGVRGKSRPRPAFIYAYQNISQPCYHYIPETRSCHIRDKRPIACRCFPVTNIGGHITLHSECTGVKETIPQRNGIYLSEIKGLDEELKAQREMTKYFVALYIVNVFNLNLKYSWLYDNGKNKWVQFDQNIFKKYALLRSITLKDSEGEMKVV